MDPVEHAFNLFRNSAEDRVEFKRQFFCFSEQQILNKVAFAIFGNSCKKAPHNAEWCAGSLSAKSLKNNLQEFIDSPTAVQNLKKESISEIRKVIKLLEDNRWQAAMVDDIRSSDIALILIVVTGRDFFRNLINHQNDECKVKELISESCNRIDGLKNGDRILFLTGTLAHETQMTIEKKNDNLYEVCCYDSGSMFDGVISVYHVNDKSFLSEVLFEEIYTEKFSTGTLFQLNRLLSDKRIEKSDTRITKSIQPSVQKFNTCHTRSLLALLKDGMVRKSGLHESQARVEWQLFKRLFTDFTIKKIEDDPLKAIAENKKIRWAQNSLFLKEIETCISEGKFNETIALYEKSLKAIGSKNFQYDVYDLSEVATLKFYHKQFCIQFMRWSKKEISPLKNLETLISQANGNSLFKKSVANFVKEYAIRKEKFKENLEKELDLILGTPEIDFRNFAYSANRSMDIIINKLHDIAYKPGIFRETKSKFMREMQMDFMSMDSTVLESEELDSYLKIIEDNPACCCNLDRKPYCFEILVQGLRHGKLEPIDRIVQAMSPEDQEIFHSNMKYKSDLNIPKLNSR